MPFAESIAELNEWYFFQEFVYSRTTFRPTPQQEVELADNLIWLGDMLISFQLKEREATPDADEASERKWFKKKVLDQATRQVRDTLRYLTDVRSIEVRNHRDHAFQLEFETIRVIHKLVVYLPSPRLPSDCLNVKYHRSRTAGLIHVIPARDYVGIVSTLLTPIEVGDYLSFREELIDHWEKEMVGVPEPALVGQFLHGDSAAQPSVKYLDLLKNLEHKSEEWDMSGVISKFPNRVTAENEPTDYYPIVQELASLKRNELREFKVRFQKAIEQSRLDKFTLPYRIAIPRSDCGFVFIPVTKDMLPHKLNALMNFTLAHKYDQRLSKCIGVAIGNHNDGWFNADWCFVQADWESDETMEDLLKTNNPFREVRVGELPRYRYKGER